LSAEQLQLLLVELVAIAGFIQRWRAPFLVPAQPVSDEEQRIDLAARFT
jgi:hypothetical protein